MSSSQWLAKLPGFSFSSAKEIQESILSLQPGDNKMIVVGGTIKIVSLSDDGKVSIISNNEKGTSKEVLDQW